MRGTLLCWNAAVAQHNMYAHALHIHTENLCESMSVLHRQPTVYFSPRDVINAIHCPHSWVYSFSASSIWAKVFLLSLPECGVLLARYSRSGELSAAASKSRALCVHCCGMMQPLPCAVQSTHSCRQLRRAMLARMKKRDGARYIKQCTAQCFICNALFSIRG
jgi:hypothetical protein